MESGVSQREPQGESRLPAHEPKNYADELINKVCDSPDSLPGCIGQYSKNQAVCKICKYRTICQKVVSRAEVEKLLQQLLEIATKGAVL